MTIIMFLVDTSGSLNQRTYLGTSLLDVTKGAIELFMKMRSRDPQSKWDRYMLLTFDEPPANVKAGWKENHATLVNQLKNLKASSLTTLGPALKGAFDFLNINRMQTHIDTYGQGRCPYFLEPAMIVCFTDGGSFSSPNGAPRDLDIPMIPSVPGSELTREPFRWDQKLFGIILKVPAVSPADGGLDVSSSFTHPSANSLSESSLNAMCEVTGGRSYVVQSKRAIQLSIESILQRSQPGVVVKLQRAIGLNPDDRVGTPPPLPDGRKVVPIPGWDGSKVTLFVPRNAQKGAFLGNWPLPESYWPDLKAKTLTPRDCHPTLRFSMAPTEPVRGVEGLPVDKYELEPCPLSKYIIERAQPNICWQVSMDNSGKYTEPGLPFGYLRLHPSLQMVHLYVLPYNYPVFVPLLSELRETKMKPNPKWKLSFDNYIKGMPLYYSSPLRRALSKLRVPHSLMPDGIEGCLGYAVSNYLRQMVDKAKAEYNRINALVGSTVPRMVNVQVTPKSSESLLGRADFKELMSVTRGDVRSLAALKGEITKYESLTIAAPITRKKQKPGNARNPFDVPRSVLRAHLGRLRQSARRPRGPPVGSGGGDGAFFDEHHSIPITEMSNYHEYAQRAPTPLREIETQPERLHTFGNPFKVNKNLMIDEADEMPMAKAPSSPASSRPRRPNSPSDPSSPPPSKSRKKGALPRGFPLRRPSSSLSSSPLLPDSPRPPMPLPDDAEDRIAKLIATHSNSAGRVELSSGEDSDVEMVIHPRSQPLSATVIRNPAAMTNGFGDSSTHSQNGFTKQGDAADRVTSPGATGDRVTLPGATCNGVAEAEDGVVAEKFNNQLLNSLMVEVRRPGRNFDVIFRKLNTVQGDLRTRLGVVRQLMTAASKFRRSPLVGLLAQFEKSMIDLEKIPGK